MKNLQLAFGAAKERDHARRDMSPRISFHVPAAFWLFLGITVVVVITLVQMMAVGDRLEAEITAKDVARKTSISTPVPGESPAQAALRRAGYSKTK